MQCKTLDEFKEGLQEAMEQQNMEKFQNLVHGCPFKSLQWYDRKAKRCCPECPLSTIDGPDELTGTEIICLCGSMGDIYWDCYLLHRIDKETALAELIIMGTKLLAYLENKE